MARAQDLAGLAALAGLGYMLSKKGDTAATDTSAGPGRQSLGAGYNSTETREEPRRQITDYQAEAPKDPREAGSEVPSASSQVFTQVGPDKNKRAEVYKANAPAQDASAPALDSKNQNLQSDLRSSQGSRASTTNVNYSNEAPIRGAKAVPVLPLGSSDKKTYTRKDGATAKEIKAYNDKKEAQKRLDAMRSSGGMRAKGGAIKAKKMAKGGMTSKPSSPSKRADGIASRGKTKCKMY